MPLVVLPDSVLSPSKGQIVLFDENNNIANEVVCGTAIDTCDLMPTAAPAAGKSMQRKLSTESGYPIDTDHSYDDFNKLDEPTPVQLAHLPHPEDNEDDEENDSEDNEVEDNLSDETENIFGHLS